MDKDQLSLDKQTRILDQLIRETGLSRSAFARKVGIPPSTLQSMIERGVGTASVHNVIKACQGVGITTDELIKRADDAPATSAHMTKDELQKFIASLDGEDRGSFDKKTWALVRLVKKTGLTRKDFAKKIGVPPSTLQYMFQKGIDTTSINTVMKVCHGLGIKVDDLLELTDEPIVSNESPKHDKSSVQIRLQQLVDSLEGFAAFDGASIDEMSEEDQELLLTSLENSLRLAKRFVKDNQSNK